MLLRRLAHATGDTRLLRTLNKKRTEATEEIAEKVGVAQFKGKVNLKEKARRSKRKGAKSDRGRGCPA